MRKKSLRPSPLTRFWMNRKARQGWEGRLPQLTWQHWNRRHNRCRDLRYHRAGGSAICRPCNPDLFHYFRYCLRFCRTLLCRICLHDPIAGSAYTYAYATMGEFFCLAYRLGPDPGISLCRFYRFCWLVRICGQFPERFRCLYTCLSHGRHGFYADWRAGAGWVMETSHLIRNWPEKGLKRLLCPRGCLVQSPCHVHYCLADHASGDRHKGIG